MYVKKTLGQHFLKCTWVLSAMIQAADISKEDTILEIGPGTGILTRGLALHAKNVLAIEKDEALAQALRNSLAKEGIKNVEIVEGDILKWKLPTEQKYKIVANIPYYLTSRLFRILLEAKNPPKTIVFTIQKEVAERIMASHPRMNLLGLSVQAYGRPELIKAVPAECFSPKPKIDSAIIRVSDISERFFREQEISPEAFFSLPKHAFTLKRKIILNAIGKSIPKETREFALKAAGIASARRPETLTLIEWAKLAKELTKK